MKDRRNRSWDLQKIRAWSWTKGEDRFKERESQRAAGMETGGLVLAAAISGIVSE